MGTFLKEKLYHRKMKDGLSVYVLPRKGYNKIYAMYSIHYGSIDNEFIIPDTEEKVKVPEGIAHFLEHKMFDMEYGNIFDDFAKLGTSVNAYTSYTNTTYLFSATSNFKENINLLLKFVEIPYFTEESVEKEKGIITQELRMYEDQPWWQVHFNLLKCLYHEHPVNIDIGGTVESIQRIDTKTLYSCHKTFYNPSNMVLFVTGDIEPDRVFDIVDKTREPKSVQEEIVRIYPKEPNTVKNISHVAYLDVAEPIFMVGFKDLDIGYDGFNLLLKELATGIVLETIFGKSSVFYEKAYTEGLIDDRFGFSYDGQKDYGFCTIGGSTRNPDALYRSIMQNIEENKNRSIDAEDFNRIKKKFLGNFISGFNSLETVAGLFISNYHKNINLFDYEKAINHITLENVNNRLKNFLDPSRHATSTVLPKEK